MQILLIHGPNLNLLGEREPDVYGSTTMEQINEMVRKVAETRGITIIAFQSNHEGSIIDFIHAHRKTAAGIIINPGAYTHYSYAIRDAVAGVNLPAVEVHLSDIKKREPFRQISVIEPVCVAQVSGLGAQSYVKGFEELLKVIEK
ncbi:type II 3-dehydroquinate dehydratase [candidate division KSB1 bacterium]|nr:type II 3-dehydroquinate dehydratase [candidate division KSB1 bacterium]